MKNTEKKLIMVQSISDNACLLKLLDESTDILALTPSVMLILDSLNITYKNINDFYNHVKYVSDIKLFNLEAEQLLASLDKVCEPLVSFPYAYSGNTTYFMTWFADMLYLEKLMYIIKNHYHKIILLNYEIPKKISWKNLNYDDLKSKNGSGTIALSLSNNLDIKIRIMFDILNIEFRYSGEKNTQKYLYKLRQMRINIKSLIF